MPHARYVPVTQGLPRLLTLLHDWVSLTLGGKLLEHLKVWRKPEDLTHGSWQPGEEVQVRPVGQAEGLGAQAAKGGKRIRHEGSTVRVRWLLGRGGCAALLFLC